MYKISIIFVLLAVSVTTTPTTNELSLSDSTILGIIDPTRRCGGLGTFRQLRISDCSGKCALNPGQLYSCELDFMPSMAAPQLTLKIEICMSSGFCMVVLETNLPNSSVQPGFVYTAKYSIVPNDILGGQSVEFKVFISHTDDQHLDVCVAADVDILEVINKADVFY